VLQHEAGIEDLGRSLRGEAALSAPLPVLFGLGDGLAEQFGLSRARDAGLDGGLVAPVVGDRAPCRADRRQRLVQALVLGRGVDDAAAGNGEEGLDVRDVLLGDGEEVVGQDGEVAVEPGLEGALDVLLAGELGAGMVSAVSRLTRFSGGWITRSPMVRPETSQCSATQGL
jgi:hypothetical protein